jgi:hypothetical protein
MSKKYTTVAIAYDFDGTLAKGNIQENSGSTLNHLFGA